MSFIVKGLNCPEGCNRCYFEFEENGVHKCKVVYHGVTEKVRKFAYGRLEECPLEDAEPQEWIPIKTRPLTKEEKEHYAEMGYSDDSVTFMYDCPLPDDGEEVLVTDWLGNVELDTFIRDECDGCYFEENCDDGEVVAWKHKPSEYKGDEE